MKIYSIEPVFVDEIPGNIEEGKLYLSKQYKTAIHLCACGCGKQTVTPLGRGGWIYTENNNVVKLWPSVGNFSGERPHHAHYYITNNKIDWLSTS